MCVLPPFPDLGGIPDLKFRHEGHRLDEGSERKARQLIDLGAPAVAALKTCG